MSNFATLRNEQKKGIALLQLPLPGVNAGNPTVLILP
jgi:hypothetical protein